MTTSLHDRLADLADDAPPGGPVPDLWNRGRRYHRRRRAGAIVVGTAVVVLLGVLGTLTWQRAEPEPLPAGPTDGLRLPDRFYDPSRRLPTTHEDGPLGRLAAVLGSEGGLVGVSGSTGVYRRLDLPGWSWDDQPLGSSDIAVSADGRWVGYWYVEDGRVAGVAAYDAVTDEVTRHDVDSEFGLSPNGMAWVGDRLWYSSAAFLDATGTSARGGSTTVWSPSDGEAQEVPLSRSPSFGNETTSGDRVVEQDRRGVAFYSPEAQPERLRVGPSFGGPVPVSPDGGRLAVLLDPTPSSTDDTPLPVAVLTPDGDGGTVSRRVPDLRTNALVAWRDDRHLVVWTYGQEAYQLVDVDTGATSDFVTPAPAWAPGMHVAADAWSAPTYHATPPPTPLDPRLVTAVAVAVVVIGGWALLLWRRRVRA